MSLYYTYWDNLPDDCGFAVFGKEHILWLVGITVAIVIISLVFVRCRKETQSRILKVIGLLILGWEVYKDIVLMATGYWEFQYLPLHLCGLAVFIELIFAFWPVPFFGELVCVACLPGAAAALLFPDWSRYPMWNYMNLHGFCVHGLLILLPILVLVSGYYVPSVKRIYMPLAFLLGASPILYRINVWQGTNFMFLNWPSMDSPFEGIYNAYGYGAYLASFFAVVAGVILVMYGVTKLIDVARRKISGHKENQS